MMKKNLEEMQVKVANKRAILESHDGEEFSPITVAKNVLCEDGTTMQDYFDNHSEPNISTKIVNSNSMSKVGQGDNVDFSDNVMNGAYEDVVLKGKSLVNVIQGSSKDKVVLPYSFEEGERVTINDTHSNGRVEVEVKGKTLVNLHTKQTYKLSQSPESQQANKYENIVSRENYLSFDMVDGGKYGWSYVSLGDLSVNMLKPNTKYLVWFETVASPNGFMIGFKDSSSNNAITKSDYNVTSGNYAILTTVGEIVNNNQRLYVSLNATSVGHYEFKNAMIIEYQEGMENWDIPYFEGMASVQTPTIQTCGKNLLDPNSVELIVKSDNSAQTITYDTKTDTYECLCPNSFNQMNILFKNKYDVVNTNQMFISGTYESDGGVHEISKRCHLENGEIGFYIIHDWKPVTKANVKIMFTKEEITSSTTYERYQSSSLILPEEVILRSLPNGVCDTFNTRTGVYTQRVYETKFVPSLATSNNQWFNSATDWTNENARGVYVNFDNLTVPCPKRKRSENVVGQYILCDKLKQIPRSSSAGAFGGETKGIVYSSSYMGVMIPKSELREDSKEGVLEWLETNQCSIVYELETPIVTKINLPSTLKSYNSITHISSAVGENSLIPTLSDVSHSYSVVIKPSTKYSIIAHKDRNNHSNHLNYTFDLGGATTTCSVNDTITTVTTPTTLSHQELRVKGQGLALSSVRVIEGEVTQDLPYFEGICDVKSPVVKNVGKNLFDINGEVNEKFSNMLSDTKPNTIEGNTVIASSCTSFHHGKGQKIKVKCGESYTCSFTTSNEGRIIIHTPNKINFTGSKTSTFTFTAPTDCDEVTIAFNTAGNTGGGKIHNLCVIEGTTEPIEREPYKSNTTTFTSNDDEIIVLRSLPSGVCDTLNVRTGEYVQRIGEIALDGTQDFRQDVTSGDFKRFTLQQGFITKMKIRGDIVCDKLTKIPDANATQEGITVGGSEIYKIMLWVKSSRLSTTDNEGIKTWLSQNPVIVQYELETPIVKQVNVEGYPYAYENGHILLESGSQEQSLTPTIEYSIVANRGGQIRSNQRMVERHQKKLDSLYAMTLVNMIDSQYKQVLMKLKSELGIEVRTWDIE